MRRIYVENWLLTKLGFKLVDSEQGMRTYAKYDGDLYGHRIDLIEVSTSMHYIHISYKVGKKYWVFWKATWTQRWLANAEDVKCVFDKFFEENRNEINTYIKKKVMIKEFKTRTGCIYSDDVKRLEWLYVGDYGKENNIKADFLGLTSEINGVKHHDVDLEDKMVVTISTQKGCPMNCQFCDCPKVGFYGNASIEDLRFQVAHAIRSSGCEHTTRFNLHLARMGELSLNARNILKYLYYDLKNTVNNSMRADVIHPVFTTMLPKVKEKELPYILTDFCNGIKNGEYFGEAGLQLSINSTDDKQREELFRGHSCSLETISKIAELLPMPVGRKYTLNFPVTAQTVLDPLVLSQLFDKDKFIVKITPIHETNEAKEFNLQTQMGYYKYDVYRQFEQPLIEAGWDVIVFIPSVEEDEDRITCGNALLSQI